MSLLIALVPVIGTVGYVATVVISPSSAITYGIGYIILVLSAPLIASWVRR